MAASSLRQVSTHAKLRTTAPRGDGKPGEPWSRLFLLPDTFFVEGELTSNGYQLTSQGGSVAEEGRDKDQSIMDDLLPESQKGEELAIEIRDCLHAQRY